MFTNSPVEDAVIASLGLDPRIPDSVEIAVSAEDGIITLRGTVESFGQRRAAGEDATKIEGVYQVHNQLKVNLTGPNRLLIGPDRRADDKLRGAALQALIRDDDVPSDSIDVKVEDGWVTLTGYVDYQSQSDAAYDDVIRLDGVSDVTNEIRVN